MVKFYNEAERINDLFNLLINGCDSETLAALTKLFGELTSSYHFLNTNELDQYHEAKDNLLEHVKVKLLTSTLNTSDISPAIIEAKAKEIANKLNLPLYKNTAAPLTNLSKQLKTVYNRLANYRYLQEQNFIEPQQLIAANYKAFSVERLSQLPDGIRNLINTYQDLYNDALELSHSDLLANTNHLAQLKEAYNSLILQGQTSIAQLHSDEQLQDTIKKAFKAYKKNNGIVKFLVLINSNNKVNIFNEIKSYIPDNLQEAARQIISGSQVFNSLIQELLTNFIKQQPKRTIHFPQTLLTEYDKENNSYFGKDFNKDDPEQAIPDFRRDNHFAKNGFSIDPDESAASVKNKVFQFAKNSIVAKHLLARGGQSHQQPLALALSHLEFTYKDPKNPLYFASTVASTHFADAIETDEEGDYLFTDISFKIYALFNSKTSKYLVANQQNASSLDILSCEEKYKELDTPITNNQAPARPPLLQASLQKKLYIDAYAFKQGEKYFAMAKKSNKLVAISAKEYHAIKDMLTQGKTPGRAIIPLKMIPPEIAYSTTLNQAENLLGKIRVKNLKLKVDDYHEQLAIKHNIKIEKKPVKKVKTVVHDENYYQNLRERLKQLKEEKRQLELAPDSLEKQKNLNAKQLEIVNVNLERIKIEKHNYKSLFHTPRAGNESFNPTSSAVVLAEYQLAEHKLKENQINIQLAMQHDELKTAHTERTAFVKQNYGQLADLIKNRFSYLFSKGFDLLEKPALHIRKQLGDDAHLSERASRLEATIEQTLYKNNESKYNINFLDKEKLTYLINDISHSIKAVDDYLAETKRSTVEKIMHGIKKPLDKLVHQQINSDGLSRTKLKAYRSQLVKLRQAMISSEYNQLLTTSTSIADIKTTDNMILKAQTALKQDSQYQAMTGKIYSLEQSIAELEKTKNKLNGKIANKETEIAEIMANKIEHQQLRR